MTTDKSQGKCNECGKTVENHELTVCDQCLQRFCDEHIYVGIDTGEMHLKNFCKTCLDAFNEKASRSHYDVRLYDDFTQMKSKDINRMNPRHHKSEENKQINVPLLQKSLLETVSSNRAGNGLNTNNINSTDRVTTKKTMAKGSSKGLDPTTGYPNFAMINKVGSNTMDSYNTKTMGNDAQEKYTSNNEGKKSVFNTNTATEVSDTSTIRYNRSASYGRRSRESVLSRETLGNLSYKRNNGQTINQNTDKTINQTISQPMNQTADKERKSRPSVKWEYKTVFLAIDSDIEIDEQMLTHIQRDYLNVFPADRSSKSTEGPADILRTEHELVLTNRLNDLGNMGWEVVTSIPKTKSIVMTRKGKPEVSVSANITGAYIVMKRQKVGSI